MMWGTDSGFSPILAPTIPTTHDSLWWLTGLERAVFSPERKKMKSPKVVISSAKPNWPRFRYSAVVLLCFLVSCRQVENPPLTVDMPLHLEDHLDAATIIGSEASADAALEPVEWTFDQPESGWHPVLDTGSGWVLSRDDLQLAPDGDGVRLEGGEKESAVIYVDLPDWDLRDWAYVLVRARTQGQVGDLRLFFNTEPVPGRWEWPWTAGKHVYLIWDSPVHTYQLPTDRFDGPPQTGPWRQLAIGVWGLISGHVDILSVTLVPRAALYTDGPAGVRTELRGKHIRRTLFQHAPSRLEYMVRVPEGGRLDFGLGGLKPDEPVRFQVSLAEAGGEPQLLLDESYEDPLAWGQRSVDLSQYAGKEMDLALETSAEESGPMALWTAPTLSGERTDEQPNVVFYIIDGGAAQYMSLYGYNRHTTPNLERLAEEGVVFENAYSNSSWTKPSTTSFVTSLHSSVLGNWRTDTDVLPDGVVTLAERLHHAGYHTGLFTTNSYVGLISGMERGHDVMREMGSRPNSASSLELHEDFWQWREEYPGEPFYVHVQTTDVHYPYDPLDPFAGLFLDPARRRVYDEWNRRLVETDLPMPARPWSEAFGLTGVNRLDFNAAQRRLYDECLAQNDARLGKLVERLKAEGEWENTLLVVASDHGAAWWVLNIDPLPPFNDPILAAYWSRIPLMFIWPGHIPGGRRLSEPVSMIDVLPTLLELAGLDPPEISQGQSLVPLLFNRNGWEPRPVIFDQVDQGGWASFHIEVVDGRWGASLLVPPEPGAQLELPEGRIAAFQVYDLWEDPNALTSINEERPDLVEKYTAFLEAQWEAHQTLGKLFSPSEAAPLTPEQLETLRALGYIR
jgi:arylsulfatase A-like enzyme